MRGVRPNSPVTKISVGHQKQETQNALTNRPPKLRMNHLYTLFLKRLSGVHIASLSSLRVNPNRVCSGLEIRI